jgi:hypothetical protein
MTINKTPRPLPRERPGTLLTRARAIGHRGILCALVPLFAIAACASPSATPRPTAEPVIAISPTLQPQSLPTSSPARTFDQSGFGQVIFSPQPGPHQTTNDVPCPGNPCGP